MAGKWMRSAQHDPSVVCLSCRFPPIAVLIAQVAIRLDATAVMTRTLHSEDATWQTIRVPDYVWDIFIDNTVNF